MKNTKKKIDHRRRMMTSPEPDVYDGRRRRKNGIKMSKSSML